MNKKMRELLQRMQEKKNQAKAFMVDGEGRDIEKATALMDEVDQLQKEFEAEKRMFEMDKSENTPTDKELDDKKDKKDKEVKTNTFLKSVRAGLPKATSQTEGVDADGGYIVPEDISTQIEKYKEAKFSLRDLVRVVPTSRESGARTFKKKATQTGFAEVSEMGKIQGKNAMSFERKTYQIKKYGGYLPVSDELLADTDQALESEIVTWLGDEGIATDNRLILASAKTFTSKTLDKANPIDSIKDIINVELGQAYAPTTAIVTNDSGLNVLDKLKDTDGKYLLQPNPQEPMKKQLCAGALVIPVIVVPNAVLANATTKVPFFIGDFYEAIYLFDRQQLSMKASDTASVTGFNAFEQDCTLWRALVREDVVKRDDNALFFATYDTAGE